MVDQVQIQFPKVDFDKYYHITETKRSYIGGFVEENAIQTEVRSKVIKREKDFVICGVRTMKRTQTSEHPIHEIEALINSIKKWIEVRINFKGEIIGIDNIESIQEKWKAISYQMPMKFGQINGGDILLGHLNQLVKDKSEFEKTIMNSDILSLLFPPVFNQLEELGRPREIIHPSVFGQTDLPITKQMFISKHDDRHTEIRGSGELNMDKFDEEGFRTMLKTLYDKYDMSTNLDVKYQDIVELDSDGVLKFSGQMLFALVKGKISTENISHLKPLDSK